MSNVIYSGFTNSKLLKTGKGKDPTSIEYADGAYSQSGIDGLISNNIVTRMFVDLNGDGIFIRSDKVKDEKAMSDLIDIRLDREEDDNIYSGKLDSQDSTHRLKMYSYGNVNKKAVNIIYMIGMYIDPLVYAFDSSLAVTIRKNLKKFKKAAMSHSMIMADYTYSDLESTIDSASGPGGADGAAVPDMVYGNLRTIKQQCKELTSDILDLPPAFLNKVASDTNAKKVIANDHLKYDIPSEINHSALREILMGYFSLFIYFFGEYDISYDDDLTMYGFNIHDGWPSSFTMESSFNLMDHIRSNIVEISEEKLKCSI